jgi:hypothetical protein
MSPCPSIRGVAGTAPAIAGDGGLRPARGFVTCLRTVGCHTHRRCRLQEAASFRTTSSGPDRSTTPLQPMCSRPIEVAALHVCALDGRDVLLVRGNRAGSRTPGERSGRPPARGARRHRRRSSGTNHLPVFRSDGRKRPTSDGGSTKDAESSRRSGHPTGTLGTGHRLGFDFVQGKCPVADEAPLVHLARVQRLTLHGLDRVTKDTCHSPKHGRT